MRVGITISAASFAFVLLAGFTLVSAEDEPRAAWDAVQSPMNTGPDMDVLRPSVDRTPEHVGTLLARPLFMVSRRPPEKASDAPPAMPRLCGIIVTSSSAVAIFQTAGPSGAMALGEGNLVGEWTVSRITRSGVTLVAGARTAILQLGYAPASDQSVVAVSQGSWHQGLRRNEPLKTFLQRHS